MENYDVIIIGAGPAGLTAGIYTARAGLKTLILEKEFPGGRLAKAPLVENYPGIVKTSGFALIETMVQQAKSFGVEIKTGEDAADFDFRGDKRIVKTREGGVYSTVALIIAIGTHSRKLLVPGEEKFFGRGVSYCAVCDAPFYKGKVIAVIGNGNEAGEEAVALSEFGREIILIPNGELEIEDAILGELKKKNVKILEKTKVEEILGADTLNSVAVANLNGGDKRKIPVGGVFVSLGAVPMSAIIKKAGVAVDEKGSVVVDRNQATNIEGVYAAGDCTGRGMQVSTAVGEGAMAGMKGTVYAKKKIRGAGKG